MRRPVVGLAGVAALVVAVASGPAPAGAVNANIVVTTTADEVDPNDGVLSLREAVDLANTTAGADTIALAAGQVYSLTLGCSSLTSDTDTSVGDLDATDLAGLTIEGNGATISQDCPAADGQRVLQGGIGGVPLTLTDLTILGGHADCAFAVLSSGFLTMTNVTVSGASAATTPCSLAGGPYAVAAAAGVSMTGGAITGTLHGGGLGIGTGEAPGPTGTISGASIDHNDADNVDDGSGGIFATGPLTVTSSMITDNVLYAGGSGAYAAAGIGGGPQLTLTGSTILRNLNGKVGGINALHADVTASTIGDNTGYLAGGLVAEWNIQDSTIIGNTGGTTGGGLAGRGTLSRSTVSGNEAPGGHGGGLYVDGPTLITASTVTGNLAGAGGGVVVVNEASGAVGGTPTLNVADSTISGNTSTGSAGDDLRVEAGTQANPSIDAIGSLIGTLGGASDCSLLAEGLTSVGGNADTDGSCGFGGAAYDAPGIGDPELGPLADNGGPTLTMVPGPGSPLRDRIGPGAAGCAGATDQRGVARPVGVGCDIGAVEAPLSGRFHPLPPTRVLDTRVGGAPFGRVGQSPAVLPLAGVAGIGTGAPAAAVVANVTVTGPDHATYLTAWPAGRPQPLSAVVNAGVDQTIGNTAVIPLGQGGAIALASGVGSTDVVIDVTGWFDDGSVSADGFVAVPPTRLLDTRTGLGAVGPVGASPEALDVRGVLGLPTDATAVVVNLAVTEPTAGSYVTAWPEGTQPFVATMNFAPHETRNQLVVVPIGADGSIHLVNAVGTVQLVGDVVGVFVPSGSPFGGVPFHPEPPTRVVDTRQPPGPMGVITWYPATITLGGTAAVPLAATAVVGNLAVTQGTDDSYLTVWPSGPQPLAASINFGAGQTLSNLAVLGLDNGDLLMANAHGTTGVVIDATGWFGPDPAA